MGAHLGSGGLPRPWLDELEMMGQIERLSRDLDCIAVSLAKDGQDARDYPGW